jgi:hypothetical protein
MAEIRVRFHSAASAPDDDGVGAASRHVRRRLELLFTDQLGHRGGVDMFDGLAHEQLVDGLIDIETRQRKLAAVAIRQPDIAEAITPTLADWQRFSASPDVALIERTWLSVQFRGLDKLRRMQRGES